MSASVTALLVAIVGVTGTLLAPVFAQRLLMKSRQLELDSQHRQQLVDRKLEDRRSEIQYRRDTYIRLNATARDFRQALKNRTFGNTQELRTELEQARGAFNRCYSEVQLFASAAVLEAAHLTSSQLAMAYGHVKGISEHVGKDNDLEVERIRSDLNGMTRSAIQRLREAMREDLASGRSMLH